MPRAKLPPMTSARRQTPRVRLSELAAVVGGTVFGPDVHVEGVSTDSREVRAGQLFVPIVAERDGHEFIEVALHAGASAYLTSRPPTGRGSALLVPDTSAALLDLAGWSRSTLPDRVVGITGSVGKTSVKDLTAAALATGWRTAASPRSFNNEIGVPLTLFNAAAGTEAAVVEMGARGPGQIARLCEVVRPTVGVLTMIGLAHTEIFGTIEAVADAKSELLQALPTHGAAVLNADAAEGDGRRASHRCTHPHLWRDERRRPSRANPTRRSAPAVLHARVTVGAGPSSCWRREASTTLATRLAPPPLRSPPVRSSTQ